MAGVLRELCARFNKLYKRRAHVHHFTQYMEASRFDEAHDLLCQVATEYEQIQSAAVPAEQQGLLDQLLPTGTSRPGLSTVRSLDPTPL